MSHRTNPAGRERGGAAADVWLDKARSSLTAPGASRGSQGGDDSFGHGGCQSNPSARPVEDWVKEGRVGPRPQARRVAVVPQLEAPRIGAQVRGRQVQQEGEQA